MKDVAFALRGLRRAPGFAAASLLTLALGIGSAAAIFSVAYGVLLRPLPFAQPDRLVEISINLKGTGAGFGSLSAPEYMDLSRQNRAFSGVAAWTPRGRTIGGDGRPERVSTVQATASLFTVLGVRAQVGRTFTAEEDVAGGGLVIVLFFTVWARAFGRAQLGRIQGSAQMLTVIASAIGPLLLAQCQAWTGSYAAVFYVLAASVAALGVVAWRLKMPGAPAAG